MGRRDLGVCRRVCIWMGQTETAFLPASLDGSDRIWEFAGERRRFGWDGLRLDVCWRVWILRSKLGFCAPNLDLTFANREGSGGGELGDSVECRVKKKEDRIA
jgi:hypothetical protein